jgi:PAS domain S-box-containing protein
MTVGSSIDAETLGAVLGSLFEHDPPALVVALDKSGHFVPMPGAVPAKQGRLFDNHTSLTQLVVPADLGILANIWETTCLSGASVGKVRLLVAPSVTVTISCFDTRSRYGAFLAFVLDYGNLALTDARAAASIMPRVGYARKDQFALILDVDAGITEMLGWQRAEMVGHRSLEFVHPEDSARAISNWMDVRSAPGTARRVRVRQLHRSGSWVWFEMTNRNMLSDPEHLCVTTEMVNISGEVTALDALRASEQLFHRLTEAMPVGVVQSDADGWITYRNDRAREMLGNSAASTLEEQFADVAEADRMVLGSALHAVVTQGRDADITITLQQPGGARRCNVNLRALRAENGAGAGAVVCISNDTQYAEF